MEPSPWSSHFTFQAGVSAAYELIKNDFEFLFWHYLTFILIIRKHIISTSKLYLPQNRELV